MVAFSGTPPIDPTAPPVPDWLLSVADADGSDARPVIDADRVGTLHQGTGGGNPRWSPSGAHIAYVALRGGEIFDIRVVDVATGVVTTVLDDHREGGWPSYSWSAAGDRILYTAPGVPSLWSVDVTGQDRRLLVAGARSGEWQWDPPVSP